MLWLLLWAVLCFGAPRDARAWTRPGHMVTAAIAHDDLAVTDRDVIEHVGSLLARHPDRGAFEVAVGRATKGRQPSSTPAFSDDITRQRVEAVSGLRFRSAR